MKVHAESPTHLVLCLFSLLGCLTAWATDAPSYGELREAFVKPDHAVWGEVPLWWWEGRAMTKEGVTAQLELLASKGVKAVCPIQRSPGRCDPASFTPEWWELFAHTNAECKRLGMTLWAYDQVGYGHYGWLEKAAGEVQDPRTKRVSFHQAEGSMGKVIRIDLPEGDLLAARAYRLKDGQADDTGSEDIAPAVVDGKLEWKAGRGDWRVVALVAVPFQTLYLSETSGDAFIDMFYGKLERTLGKDSMGTSFVGIFQDEHPPTPRDVYTKELAQHFQDRFGYDIARAIPAQHFDVGPLTPKYRTDFFDAYLDLVERTYWKRVYDWTMERNLLTSHDNWGRKNIVRQSEGYIDYFRTQRWFSAPGYDDSGQHSLTERNYYDTKIAASIARLYGRQRVWNEAFHSSGWGRTTDQTLSWLTTGMVFGANLYDEHGLYYSTNASTWEHAAPDPHWRQPYWTYYDSVSDFVARTSYLMSQGAHVVDAAVHYPVVSLLADLSPRVEDPDPNTYMRVSHAIYSAGIDNDIIDDDSILNSRVENGKLIAGGNAYQALVFGPERTVRRAVLDKAIALAKTGGTVLFYGRLPNASTEDGRNDPKLHEQLKTLLGIKADNQSNKVVTQDFPGGGFCAFLPDHPKKLPALITNHIIRDFVPTEPNIYVTHRRMNDCEVYMLQNALEGQSNTMEARFRVDAVPELWDPFTGKVSEVDGFERKHGYTYITHRLEGNTAVCLVFRPGEAQSKPNAMDQPQPEPIGLSENWTFEVIPTRDNHWGEFRWPPSDRVIGPEVRNFRYQEETEPGVAWHTSDLDDGGWSEALYSTGPYWLVQTITDDEALNAALANTNDIATGADWREVWFSQTIAAAQAAPWGGHSGYPDGHIDKNFIHLPEGRKLLFTRIRSPKAQRRGLLVELRNSSARLWVNGVEQPFEDAVGNLPLEAGANTVLLDLSDGEHGRLFVQADPPSIATMEEAAAGSVKPDIDQAKWIWSGDTIACSVRKTFTIDRLPRQARIVTSGFSGYRLYVNGRKIEEEIGPWSNWTKPESFTITPYLQEGENVIALWGQLFAGQNVNKGPEAFASRGLTLAFKMRFADGEESGFVTDETWKGTAEDTEGWTSPGFDDRDWKPVRVAGKMGDEPWGMKVVENVGVVTEPDRPLSIDLESPYLTCFDEVPDAVYDVKADNAPRVGWYRFDAPPGLERLILPTAAKVQAWVDGKPAAVKNNIATVTDSPGDVSKVALRVQMEPGAYGGAVFTEPIGLEIGGGTIQPGEWKNFALPTYAGIGVYTQSVNLDEEDLKSELTLDLGQVLVAAEVYVNDHPVGVKLANPYTFDISDMVHAGDNTVRVHVANTIAPHYQTIPARNLGPTASGLIGPVKIRKTTP